MHSLVILKIKCWCRSPYLIRDLLSILICTTFIVFFSYTFRYKLSIHQCTWYQDELFIPILFCLYAVFDVVLKMIFISDHSYRVQLQTLPIKENVWRKFELFQGIFNGWNLYQLLFFIPILTSFHWCPVTILYIFDAYLIGISDSLVVKSARHCNLMGKLLHTLAYMTYLIVLFPILGILDQSFVLLSICTLIQLLICGIIQAYIWRANKYSDFKTIFTPKKTLVFSFIKMEYAIMWRSHLLRNNLYIAILLCINNLLLIITNTDKTLDIETIDVLLMFSLSFIIYVFSKHLIGVEANYFDGIFTKPYPLSHLFEVKFYFLASTVLLFSLVYIPAIFNKTLPIINLLSICAYCLGYMTLIIFPTMFVVRRVNLEQEFGLTMNYQGMSLGKVLLLVLEMVLLYETFIHIVENFDENTAHLIMATLGIVGLFIRKPYFKLLQKIFKTQRYKMMERFRN